MSGKPPRIMVSNTVAGIDAVEQSPGFIGGEYWRLAPFNAVTWGREPKRPG